VLRRLTHEAVTLVDCVPLRILLRANATSRENQMARKTVFVSDFSGKEIADEKQSATITIRYGDGRRGVVVADAHVDDKIVAEITQAGHQQARRGRRPKSAT
jgi:hypothetical protein